MIWFTMRILTLYQFSKIFLFLMISMNSKKELTPSKKQRPAYLSYAHFMTSILKFFLITLFYLNQSICLKTSKRNKNWLTSNIKFKKIWLRKNTNHCLMMTNCLILSFTTLCTKWISLWIGNNTKSKLRIYRIKEAKSLVSIFSRKWKSKIWLKSF